MSDAEPDPYRRRYSGDALALAFAFGVSFGILLAFGMMILVADWLDVVCDLIPNPGPLPSVS